MDHEKRAMQIRAKCEELASFLISKNRKYGDSALSPLRVFARGLSAEQMIAVRLDDKLSRLQSAQSDDNEDALLDFVGYGILGLIARDERLARTVIDPFSTPDERLRVTEFLRETTTTVPAGTMPGGAPFEIPGGLLTAGGMIVTTDPQKTALRLLPPDGSQFARLSDGRFVAVRLTPEDREEEDVARATQTAAQNALTARVVTIRPNRTMACRRCKHSRVEGPSDSDEAFMRSKRDFGWHVYNARSGLCKGCLDQGAGIEQFATVATPEEAMAAFERDASEAAK